MLSSIVKEGTWKRRKCMNEPERNPAKVAAAVIRKGSRILIACRKAGSAREGRWEFPGGTLEKGESLEECLSREIMEELGLEVKIGRKLGIVEHSYPDISIELNLFECILPDNDSAQFEMETKWVEVKDLARIDLTEADRKSIPYIPDDNA